MYAPQLFQWLQVFPATQLHLVQSEMLLSNAKLQMTEVFTWLQSRGLPSSTTVSHLTDTKDAHIVNPTKKNSKTTGGGCHDIEEELQNYFQPHEEDVFDLLMEFYRSKNCIDLTRWVVNWNASSIGATKCLPETDST